MVLALAGDSTTTSVFFVLVFTFDLDFALADVVVFAFVAAKPSLPLSTPISMQFIFDNQALQLHIEERKG